MQLFKQVITNFSNNNGSYRAAALSYTSILSLVPFCAVIFAVLSYFPFLNSIRGPLQDFIFKNFMPATGQVVQSHFINFVEHASRLPVMGSVFLVFTVVILIYEIETAINVIWNSNKNRSFSMSLLLYICLIIFTPILVALIFLSTMLLLSMDWLTHHHFLNQLSQHILLPAVPVCLTFLLLLFFYKVLPRQHVQLSAAAVGAGFVTAILELSKWGFSWYLDRYDTYEVIYGAFAAIPIILIWIYWLWMIVLIGAELTHLIMLRNNLKLTN